MPIYETQSFQRKGDAFQTYQDAEDYLRSFTDYERMVRGTLYPENLFDLARIESLLEWIGNPHRNLKGIHIAGTKGKGSTAIFVDALIRAQGLRSGLYTSPHLISKEERIQVDGQPLRKEEFLAWMNHLRPALVSLKDATTPPTFFDIITTIAFLHFQRHKVEAATMEVGLGGRLDSTNVFLPQVCMITSLGLDHTDKLGSTLDRIASEKAGIIKPGVYVVSHPQPPDAGIVIERTCKSLGVPLERVGKEILVENDRDADETLFEVRTPRARYTKLRLSVLGRHQMINAAAAIRATEIFLEQKNLGSLDQGTVRATLAKVSIPGRIEVIGHNPLVVVDGAHNTLSMKALLDTVNESLRFQDLHVLFACSRDKDIHSLLRTLSPSAARWTFTTFDFPRIEDPAKVKAILHEISPHADARATRDPSSALEDARARSSHEDLILCCGSFYLVGEILRRRTTS